MHHALRNEYQCLIYVETSGHRPSGFPCFLLVGSFFLLVLDIHAATSGETVENAPNGSLLVFGHFPRCICSRRDVQQREDRGSVQMVLKPYDLFS